MYKEIFINAKNEQAFNDNIDNISDESIVFHEETDVITVGDNKWIAIPEGVIQDNVLKVSNDKLYWTSYGDEVDSSTSKIIINESINDPFSGIDGDIGINGTPTTNAIAWIRANSHRYVGTYDANQGMLLKQLDDSDGTKYVDGSDASEDIKTKDVFMKMPDFWYTANSTTIVFTYKDPNDSNFIKWNGNTLIGVYEGFLEDDGNNTNGGIYSFSGKDTNTQTTSRLNKKASNRTNGDDEFRLISFESRQIISMLYIAWYGNTDNDMLQLGSVATAYKYVTGNSNIYGMNDTVSDETTCTNFWGLENWGLNNTILSGITIDANSDYSTHDESGLYKIEINNKTIIKTCSTRTDYGSGNYGTVVYISGTIKKLSFDKKGAIIIPNSISSSSNSRYGTTVYYFTLSTGSDIYIYIKGLFYMSNNSSESSKFRSRIEYRGRVNIID